MSSMDDLAGEERRYFERNQMRGWITTLRVIGVIIWVTGAVIAIVIAIVTSGAVGSHAAGLAVLSILKTLFGAFAMGAFFFAISYIMTALGWIEQDTHLLAQKSKETAGTTDRKQDSTTR